MNINSRIARSITLGAALLILGCHGQPAAVAPPPPTITVSNPVAREVRDWDDYSGRLQSPDRADITARVSGFIVEVPFKEGALVKQGDVLFVMDDRPFKADLENKVAQVQKDEAQLSLADVQLKRSAELLKSKTVAQQDYDTNKAQQGQLVAQLAADKAAADIARLNLEWSRVVAPIAGRVSRMNVTVGNQVVGGAGQATVLTSIVSVDPMYCLIAVPGSTFLEYQKIAQHEDHEGVRHEKIPCYVGLESEEGFPHVGMIDFIDNAVDPNTGTILMRGSIPNPNGQLTPGAFARTRISRGNPYKTLLVPDKAVGTEQTERYLLIVGKDDVVESRPVKTGGLFGSLRAITSGVDIHDRVVVNGLQRAQPGGKVSPQEEAIPAEALTAADSELRPAAPAPPAEPAAAASR